MFAVGAGRRDETSACGLRRVESAVRPGSPARVGAYREIPSAARTIGCPPPAARPGARGDATTSHRAALSGLRSPPLICRKPRRRRAVSGGTVGLLQLSGRLRDVPVSPPHRATTANAVIQTD